MHFLFDLSVKAPPVTMIWLWLVTGVLHLLPISKRLWSHPLCRVYDWIGSHFNHGMFFQVRLPKLPSTKENTEIFIKHVFHLHSIVVDIISDQRPQFTSQVWKAFCKSLGANTSLISGYHPQSNEQKECPKQDLRITFTAICHVIPLPGACFSSMSNFIQVNFKRLIF